MAATHWPQSTSPCVRSSSPSAPGKPAKPELQRTRLRTQSQNPDPTIRAFTKAAGYTPCTSTRLAMPDDPAQTKCGHPPVDSRAGGSLTYGGGSIQTRDALETLDQTPGDPSSVRLVYSGLDVLLPLPPGARRAICKLQDNTMLSAIPRTMQFPDKVPVRVPYGNAAEVPETIGALCDDEGVHRVHRGVEARASW